MSIQSYRRLDEVACVIAHANGVRTTVICAGKPNKKLKKEHVELVQEANSRLLDVSLDVNNAAKSVKKTDMVPPEEIEDLKRHVAESRAAMKALPSEVRKAYPEKEYANLLRTADRLVKGDINQRSQKVILNSLGKNLEKTNKKNPFLKKSRKKMWMVLGYSALVVVILALGIGFFISLTNPAMLVAAIEGAKMIGASGSAVSAQVYSAVGAFASKLMSWVPKMIYPATIVLPKLFGKFFGGGEDYGSGVIMDPEGNIIGDVKDGILHASRTTPAQRFGTVLANRNCNAKTAVMRSAAVLAARGSMQTASAPELTVKELERVQTACKGLTDLTDGLVNLVDSGLTGDAATAISRMQGNIGKTEKMVKSLPNKLKGQINAKGYILLLDRADSLLGSLAGAMGTGYLSGEQSVESVEVLIGDFNELHENNPTMRQDRANRYMVLGAGTLAVALLAIGAFMLMDEPGAKLKSILEDGVNFIEKAGNRFLITLNRGLGNLFSQLGESFHDVSWFWRGVETRRSIQNLFSW